jgi:hypothetical protein
MTSTRRERYGKMATEAASMHRQCTHMHPESGEESGEGRGEGSGEGFGEGFGEGSMTTEAAAMRPHCMPMRPGSTEGSGEGSGDGLTAAAEHRHSKPMHPGPGELDAMRELSEDERREYDRKTTEEKKKAVHKRLAQLGACYAGYNWVRVSGGYRCSANVCFISDARMRLDVDA